MARSNSVSIARNQNKRSAFSWEEFWDNRRRDLKIFVLCALGLFAVLSIVTFHMTDPSFNTVAPVETIVQNLMGNIGAHFADIVLQSFGLGSILLPVFLFMGAYRIYHMDDISPILWRCAALCGAMISFGMMLALIPSFGWLPQSHMGGIWGGGLLHGSSNYLATLIGFKPTIIIALLGLGLFVVLFDYALGLRPDEREKLMAHMLRGGAVTVAGASTLSSSIWNRLPFRSSSNENDDEDDSDDDSDDDGEEYEDEEYEEGDEDESSDDEEYEDDSDDDEEDEAPRRTVVKRAAPTKAKPKSKKQAQLDLREPSEWELPTVEFLQEPPKQANDQLDENALRKNADLLQNVLGDYNVSGDISSIHPGPVVTLYELEPSPGTKTSRVVGLSDDIARSMSAVSVRVATVPGRNVIGIELPNKKRQTVYLRDLLEGPEFDDNNAKLPLVLGKDIGGQPIIADLARMPHLLVAGTTGSGKSVAVNTMILSLLYKLPPEKCRFIMIDPKMLELSVYDDIPHLLAPVVTEAGRAVVALKWTVQEMENRYRNMSKLGVRNIEGYNARVKEARKKGEILMRKVQTGFDAETGKPVFEEQPLDLNEIPYIVVIVDEFADLMLVAGKDVENAIQRLAQMARAAGIHLIMATQRPSVDVITGVIKANFPTRISFQVTSKIDSRTILGEGGAETLLGMGDMLYMAAGGRITRVHGPFVSDKEVEDVVAFLKAQGEPEYLEEVTEGDFGGDGSGESGSSTGDELYDRAVALVAEEGKASTSFIQRHLQIGYNRAARIIEDMEKNGVVGKANHVGKREVLVGEHRRY